MEKSGFSDLSQENRLNHPNHSFIRSLSQTCVHVERKKGKGKILSISAPNWITFEHICLVGESGLHVTYS